MPSYLELQSEQVWWDQFVPDNLTTLLIDPLRAFYNLSAGAVGSAGDNNHMYGRHRSANWDLTSAFCTDRSYGTTNEKDRQGHLDWYRAVDVGIQGQPLWDASHRLDSAVRSGQAPAIAEWFGTFDGQTVVGWFEGHSSSSDDSHLWHLHVGFWNQYANDPVMLKAAFAVITGTEPEDEGGDDDMLMVGQAGSTGAYEYYVGNGFWHRKLSSKAELDNLAAALGLYGQKAPILNYGEGSSTKGLLGIIGPTSYDELNGGGGSGGSGLTFDETVQAAQQGAELAEDS